MVFLEAFEPQVRSIFEDAAQRVALDRGDHLIRRGQPGGDVFLLLDGSLDVVDTRSNPEVILNTLEPGSVLGEIAFIDGAPRSADVRARTASTVLCWEHRALRGLLRSHPTLSASFYEAVAQLAAARVRSLTDHAIGAHATLLEGGELTAWIRRLSGRVKSALPALETGLREDPRDPHMEAQVGRVLDDLQGSVAQLFGAYDDPVTFRKAEELLRQELHPYLARSLLADRSLRRGDGVSGHLTVLNHAVTGQPTGDGPLGVVIDRWLLARPTFRARRDLLDALPDVARPLLPTDREIRATVINVGTGRVLTQLTTALEGSLPATVTVVDHVSDAVLAAQSSAMGPSVQLVSQQGNPARIAVGRTPLDVSDQDIVVVDGLLEHLPERMAVGLVAACRAAIHADGVVLVSNLTPSPDRVFLDRLLGWPTIRRSPTALTNLMAAAGLSSDSVPQPPPGQWAAGRVG